MRSSCFLIKIQKEPRMDALFADFISTTYMIPAHNLFNISWSFGKGRQPPITFK